MGWFDKVFRRTKSNTTSGVRFKERLELPTIDAPGMDQYEVYEADSEAQADAFLASKDVRKMHYYIVVETPEGVWGKDCLGQYAASQDWRG